MLKVGDTFEENGILHKIIGQNDSGLICQVIDGDIVKAAEAENDYLSMPYAQLKKICAEKGLDATGTKADLIARLEG